MMRKVHFIQADVFSDSPFGGNPVVVVPDPGPISAEEMQALARGMNFAETGFVVDPSDPSAAFGLRCYTPTTEVVFSGHQLLGTAYVLAMLGRVKLDEPVSHVLAETGDGLHPVTFTSADGEVSRVSIVERGADFLQAVEDYGALAAALSIDPMEIVQTGLPVQVVQTELACVVVPVRRLATVREMMPVGQSVDKVLQDCGGVCALVYTTETLSAANDVHVRVFAPALGIEEDPATATANGALAAYLVNHGAVDAQPVARLRSEQGSEMGRPSVIEMEVDTASDPPTIHVGGRVARSVEGSVFY
jgi:trans-2,3-dihydro-3-hydroxyanthranilate isomerase